MFIPFTIYPESVGEYMMSNDGNQVVHVDLADVTFRHGTEVWIDGFDSGL